MSDTQWKNDLESTGGENTCATGIIDALNQQFINHKLQVRHPGWDLVDKDRYTDSSDGSHNLATHAAHREVLYDAGIGFYPCAVTMKPAKPQQMNLYHFGPRPRVKETM